MKCHIGVDIGGGLIYIIAGIAKIARKTPNLPFWSWYMGPSKITQNPGNIGNESPQIHAAAGLAELPTSLPKAFCSNSRQYGLIKDKKTRNYIIRNLPALFSAWANKIRGDPNGIDADSATDRKSAKHII